MRASRISRSTTWRFELAGALRGATVAKERVLAIGDGIATDIAGAVNFGVALGLHRERRARAGSGELDG